MPFPPPESFLSFRACTSPKKMVYKENIPLIPPILPLQLRMIDGSGREYLWTVCENPDILENPLNFVVGLVHATFKDGVGYVEGLSKDKVDHYITRFMTNKPSFHNHKGDKVGGDKERNRLIKLILQAVEELKGEIEDLEHRPSQIGDIDGPLDAMLKDVLELKLKARELLNEGENGFLRLSSFG